MERPIYNCRALQMMSEFYMLDLTYMYKFWFKKRIIVKLKNANLWLSNTMVQKGNIQVLIYRIKKFNSWE